MKYMHFNSSCSYAGLANMLEMQGYDTEDYKIALDIDLPCHIRYDGKTGYYMAGAMLQSKEWFDLYLRPRGFSYMEKSIPRWRVTDVLSPGLMLGIRISPQSKHAVVFVEKEKDKFIFLNNKWETSAESELYIFTEGELLERLPEDVTVGLLVRDEIKKTNLYPYFNESLATWKQLRKELFEFVSTFATPKEIQKSRDRLFRPLLVDGLAMMKLLGQREPVVWLETVQRQYLDVVNKNQAVRMADEMDISIIDRLIEGIMDMIDKKIRDSQ